MERRFRDRGTDGAYLFAAVQFISGVGCGFGCGGAGSRGSRKAVGFRGGWRTGHGQVVQGACDWPAHFCAPLSG